MARGSREWEKVGMRGGIVKAIRIINEAGEGEEI
jgi:hypothetical protein